MLTKSNRKKKTRVEKKEFHPFLYFPTKDKQFQNSSSFVLVQTETLLL